MCKAFSGIVDRSGKVYWKFAVDSHEDIKNKFNLLLKDKRKSDLCPFEIAPMNGNYLQPDKWDFRFDENIIPDWWKASHEKHCWEAYKRWKLNLDKTLIYKKIVHPLEDVEFKGEVTIEQKALLKQWASVWDSVGASVRDSVWAYIGSFFVLKKSQWKYTSKIKCKGYPFQPCVDLWEQGLVPSFDGTTWRLHAGEKAKIVYEVKATELRKMKFKKERGK